MKTKSKAELLQKMQDKVQEPEAHRLIRKLLKDPEWGHFFQFSCECGPDRFTSQVWQWHDELKARGWRVQKSAVEDALLELAHELLPDSPAGEDPRRYLFNRVARWIASLGRPFKTTDAEDVALNDAFYATLPEFREALRAWVKAGLEAGKKAA